MTTRIEHASSPSLRAMAGFVPRHGCIPSRAGFPPSLTRRSLPGRLPPLLPSLDAFPPSHTQVSPTAKSPK
jgi:hypothetical protein